MKSDIKYKDNYNDERRQKVIARDNQGRIIKTFDGYVYRIFDSEGRMSEYYGNFKRVDNNANFHTFIQFSDSLILVKEYFLDDDNTSCKILNPEDYFIRKYFYDNGKLIKDEYYNPVKNDKGKVVGYKLVEVGEKPWINPYLGMIPDYLK